MKHAEPLGGEVQAKYRYAGYVATRSIEARDRTELDGVVPQRENDRDRRCRRLGREQRGPTSRRDDHCDSALDPLICKGGEPIIFALRPAKLDSYISTVRVPASSQTALESFDTGRPVRSRFEVEIADDGNIGSLCTRYDRGHDRDGPYEPAHVAPLHSTCLIRAERQRSRDRALPMSCPTMSRPPSKRIAAPCDG